MLLPDHNSITHDAHDQRAEECQRDVIVVALWKESVNVVVNVTLMYTMKSVTELMKRHADILRDSELPVELESQFVLRLPPVRTFNMCMSSRNLDEVFNVNISVSDPPVTVFINCIISFIGNNMPF